MAARTRVSCTAGHSFGGLAVHEKSVNAAVKPIIIHISGLAYIFGLIPIGWQTLLGYSVAEWSLLPILAGSCFLVAFTPVIWLISQSNAPTEPYNRTQYTRNL